MHSGKSQVVASRYCLLLYKPGDIHPFADLHCLPSDAIRLLCTVGASLSRNTDPVRWTQSTLAGLLAAGLLSAGEPPGSFQAIEARSTRLLILPLTPVQAL